MKIKTGLKSNCLAVTVMVLAFSPATARLRADAVTWVFEEPLVFKSMVFESESDPAQIGYGYLSGSFVFDASTNSYLDPQFTFTSDRYFPVTFGGPSITIQAGKCTVYNIGSQNGFCVDDGYLLTYIALVSNVATAGATAEIGGEMENVVGDFGLSYNNAELLATPEPGAAFLSLLGALGLFGVATWRKYAGRRGLASLSFRFRA
jgi:hypothetical protein